MITPLKPHHGQHGGLIAFGVLVVAAAVVWWSHPTETAAPPKPAAHAVAQKPTVPQLDTTKPFETAVIAERDFERHIATTGFATFDESSTAHIQVPVSGWLVQVKPTGKTVKRGEPLATLYSMDIIAAELELMAQADHFTTQEDLNHARNKLARFGIPAAQIQRVEQTRTLVGTLPIWAWGTGTVVDKHVFPGMFVDAWTEVYTISDPTRSWVVADLPDGEDVAVGTPAKLTVADGKPIDAKVAYVYSTMHKVRFELANKLPRDAQVAVELSPAAERGLAVPDTAIVRFEDRVLVYVMKNGVATPSEVKLGTHANGYYRVIGGVAAGDTLVVEKQLPQS